MSEDNEPKEKMSESAKLAIAVVGAILVGFALVGLNNQQSTEQKESSAMVRNYFNLQTMATEACPKAIKDATGEQVYFPSETDSDKDSYITLKWVGEKKGGFKKASCTIKSVMGGISELIIDDKAVIQRKSK
ncbi:hypothetical protein [Methyloglobulus sp.]|uniref:hypothetical protein n=1 Tax=Methyloglobulus sp. TaxID=2518622 RepID=UPI0032B7B13F